MQDFNSMFPNFLARCSELKAALIPIAYLLLVGGLISSTITGHRSPSAYLRTFGRTIVLVTLLTFIVTWGNEITVVVDNTVKNVLKSDPAKIHERYLAALEVKKTAQADRGWLDKVFEWRASLLEAVLTAIFFFLGWFASALVWWAYILQSAILFIGYGLSPVFIGFCAFQNLREIGRNYLLNLVGVMLWPLGWGVAGIITDGVIDFMTDRSFLQAPPLQNPALGSEAYSVQNLMGLALLGIWLIFSTIAAPVIIQKAIAQGRSAASDLFGGALATGRTAAGTGASTLIGAGSGASGIREAIAAGAVSTAATMESLSASAINGGYAGGSLIGSLTQTRNHGLGSGESESVRFPADDPTGARTAAEMIQKHRNQQSGGG